MGLPAESQPTETDRTLNIKRESFALGEAVMRAERFVTHENPDIDALLSVALAQLYRRFMGERSDLPISFVPGGTRDFQKGTLALDIGIARGLRSYPSGGMSLKASIAGGSSCMAVARLLREDDYKSIKTLVEEVSLCDESGEGNTVERLWVKHRLWRYGDDKNVLLVTSVYTMFHDLRFTLHDFELYELFVKWVDGILIRGHKRRASKQKNPWDNVEVFYNGRYAILPIGGSIYQARSLEQQGVEVSLNAVPMRNMQRDSWSLALHRAPQASLNFTDLFQGKMDDFPGVFVSDFFVGWGAKGGPYKGTESEFRILRDRFIERTKEVLGPWYTSPQH